MPGAMPTKDEFSVLTATDVNVANREIERLARGLFASVNNLSRPTISVTAASFNIGTGTDTAVTFVGPDSGYDPDVMFNPSQPNRVTVKSPGLWLWSCQTRFSTNGTGSRAAKIMVDGIDPAVHSIASGKLPGQADGEGTTVSFTAKPKLFNVDQQVFLNMWQSSGSTLSAGTGFGGVWLAGVWLGPPPT